MLNYFEYDYPAPTGAEPIALHVEETGRDPRGQRSEFIQLVEKARELGVH